MNKIMYKVVECDGDRISPPSPRPTLRLKVGARKPTSPGKIPSTPQSERNTKLRPQSRWSDKYVERMQAEMDALTVRRGSATPPVCLTSLLKQSPHGQADLFLIPILAEERFPYRHYAVLVQKGLDLI
jgi:hypothetical protein